MRYLDVLDARSTVGQVYLAGKNDGLVSDGNIQHPALDCLEVDLSPSHYMLAKRDLTKHGKSQQTLLIPHHCIAFIQVYAMDAPAPLPKEFPFGFTPAAI